MPEIAYVASTKKPFQRWYLDGLETRTEISFRALSSGDKIIVFNGGTCVCA